MKLKRSRQLFNDAQRYLPGGVNSPVRAFKAVGGIPPFIVRGQGSRIYDADGNEFIDYVCSWGALVLGHAHPRVVAAIKRAAEKGTSFGAPTELETNLARIIVSAMPSIEMVRFVNSGTEAVMSALRLARAYTGRDKIIKFAGGYHGHADGLLGEAGSGVATLNISGSPGVPASFTQNTLTAPYNNTAAVEQLFQHYPEEIAAVIVEPVAANMGVVPPRPDFLPGLRQLTQQFGALLVFDEVITGFRVSYGGAQTLFGISPDLTCLGKIIGGGLPVGAYAGRREIMEMVAPAGPVYQAGTLSGNPIAMTAGIETLTILAEPGLYAQLEEQARTLEDGINQEAAATSIKFNISRIGSLLTIFFSDKKVVDYETAKLSNTKLYGQFFHQLLSNGIYWPPSQFETAFISISHTHQDNEKTIREINRALSFSHL